jgi:hypothetical protein
MCENGKYGDGEIVEIMEVGSREEPKQSIRVVPNNLLAPQVPIAGLHGLQEREEQILDGLVTEGLRV